MKVRVDDFKKRRKLVLTIRLRNRLSVLALKYFKENWGAPFIIVFMVLLLFCAGLLASGFSSLANSVAVYAYYFLVTGVVLQLISYLKYERGRDAG